MPKGKKNALVQKRARKRTWTRKEKKDRRNLKLWAEGARESILRPHLPAYTDALERGWRAERDYVREVCNEFHAKISWRLADDEEPDLPLPEYDPLVSAEPEELDDAETVAKRERIETMNARINRWLKYRATKMRRPKALDRMDDPWALLLAKLSGITSPPKARQGYQQYMRESYETEIKPVVEARWKASCVEEDGVTLKTSKGPGAPFRAEVARELFQELSEEQRDEIKARAKAEALADRTAYVEKMKNPPSKAPEARQKCIDNLGAFMTEVLKGVYEHTGLASFAVFGGPMPGFEGELRTLTVAYGRNLGPNPCHFPQWAKPRFAKDVLGFMKEWLPTAYTPTDCAEAALPKDGDAEGDDPLAHAKYTIGDDDEDSDSDSSSSGTNSTTDSDSDGDTDSDSDSANSDVELDWRSSKKKRTKKDAQKKKSRAKGNEKVKERAEDVRKRGKAKANDKGKGKEKLKERKKEKEKEAEKKRKEAEKKRKEAEKQKKEEEKKKKRKEEEKKKNGEGSSRGGEKRRREDEEPEQRKKKKKDAARAGGAGAETNDTFLPQRLPLRRPLRRPPPPASPPAPPPAATPPPAAAPLPPPPACIADAPDDFKEVYVEVSAHALGADFNALLRLWCDLEKEYKWERSQRGLSTKNRPSQVASWITAGRGSRGPMGHGAGPTLSNITGYDESWWEWWGGLQPSWRIVDGNKTGRFKREEYPAGSDAKDWVTLRFPGKNGALSLVASLYWWGKRMNEKNQREREENWIEAVRDVTWVLTGLLQAEKRRAVNV
ncbi:hypothetical protein R3P38DRAFT_3187034 [Favolaschia claudopus]|uniref:Uncharacterized protein n=1 Tax=Favolaschia claudopus TaxID=2862362 RepID=A0AAW0BYC2_9AGAR